MKTNPRFDPKDQDRSWSVCYVLSLVRALEEEIATMPTISIEYQTETTRIASSTLVGVAKFEDANASQFLDG